MTLAMCVALLGTLEAGLSAPPLVNADVEARPVVERAQSLPHFALVFDAGAPDGAGAALALRPWSWLRIHAGVLTNAVSPGIRAGLTLVPFHFPVTPTLTLEAGHFFDGNANAVAGYVLRDANFQTPALDHFGYDFANAQLGLELGPPDRWAFYVRAGVSYLRPSSALAQGIGDAARQATGGLVSVRAGALWMPSVKLGMTLYLF